MRTGARGTARDFHEHRHRRADDGRTHSRQEPPQQQPQPPTGSWFAALGDRGRRGFRAAFAGYMLDAFDLIVLTLSLTRSA